MPKSPEAYLSSPVMDPFVAGALRIAPMAKQVLDRYRANKVSQTLDRLVRADLIGDDSLTPSTAQQLADEWGHVHDDPLAATLVDRLLHERDVRYLDALAVRSNKLLAGLELLPLEPDAVAERLVRAVRNSYIAAQRDDRQAIQAAATATLTAIEDLPQRADFTRLAETVTRGAGRPAPLLILPGDVGADEERLLAEARVQDRDAAAELARLLNAGGHARLAQFVVGQKSTVDDRSAVFWLFAGRILALRRDLCSAQAAFERRAAHPDVPDRTDAIVTAARAAWLDGRPEDADSLLADAAVTTQLDHPAVVLFAAERETDHERRLELLDAVTPTTDRDRGRAEGLRAGALLILEKYDESRAAAAASIAADPHGAGPELAAAIEIQRARALHPERDRDDRPLLDAIAFFEDLATEADAHDEPGFAGLARARAAIGYGLIGDRATAEAKIDEAIAVGPTALALPPTRAMLVDAAVALEDAERAERLLAGAPDDQEGRFLQISVRLQIGDDLPAAIADLDAFIADLEEGPVRREARLMRLLAAEHPDVPLDESVAEGLEDGNRLLAHVRATRALSTGDTAVARQALAGLTDARTLALQRDIAIAENRPDDAIRWQTTLARRQPAGANELRLAAMQGQNGKYVDAIATARSLATDDRRATALRANAYAIAAQAAFDSSDWHRLEDIADRWGELAPNSADPRWSEALALARQGRHAEGLAHIDAHKLEPDTLSRSHLYAELIARGVPNPAERLRRMADLSDAAGRPENLEQAFVFSLLQTPDTDRLQDHELLARFHETLEKSPTAESNTTAIRPHTFDLEKDDPEQVLQQLAAVTPKADPAHEQTRREVQDGVRRGEQPIAMLAALTRRGVGEIIVRNGAHPLSVFDAATFELETGAARRALDAGAASLDETACVTLGELEAALADGLLALLPGAAIGQLTRDCVTRPVASRPAGKQVAIMHVDAEGEPQMYEEDPATVDRIRAAEDAAAAIAARLTVVPDPLPPGEDNLSRLLAASDDRTSFDAIINALAVARDQRVPVYSDDRVVRRMARGFGLEAFGTLSLIDAARGADLIPDEQAVTTAMAILDLGVWSSALSPEVYVELVRRNDWDLGRMGRALLADEAVLRVYPRMVHNAALLITLAREAPHKLDVWATAITSSYVHILNSDQATTTTRLAAVIDAIRDQGQCDGEIAITVRQALGRVDLPD
jgi:tetratricopeptide (TPR) repeat protein